MLMRPGSCTEEEAIREQLLYRNVQRFRGGLVLEAHTLCVSLDSRLASTKGEKGKKKRTCAASSSSSLPLLSENGTTEKVSNIFVLKMAKVKARICFFHRICSNLLDSGTLDSGPLGRVRGVRFPSNPGCYVTKCGPHEALKSIACRQVDF